MRIDGKTKFDSRFIEGLLASDSARIESLEKKKQNLVNEAASFDQIGASLSAFESIATKLSTNSDFTEMKMNSSHPEIMEGTVTQHSIPGTYTFEINRLAKDARTWEIGVPDPRSTPVGFGYMQIETPSEKIDVQIDPNSNLNDVAEKIRAAGFNAVIVNTKSSENPYRLLVKNANDEPVSFKIDPDTTFLDFAKSSPKQSLEFKFEDIKAQRSTNKINDLIDGLQFHVKKSEPGSQVQISIEHDFDKTLDKIKAFSTEYNSVMKNIQSQPSNTGRMAASRLQNQVGRSIEGGPFQHLSQIGITTNPKTGELILDEKKMRTALQKDYQGVAKIFVGNDKQMGIAQNVSQTIRALKRSDSGAVGLRKKSLNQQITHKTKEIEDSQRRLAEKKERLVKRMASIESSISLIQSQGSVINGQ